MKGLDILIDFDGTCVSHDYPEIGKDIGSVPVLKELVSKGHRLILYTMRSDNLIQSNTTLTEAVKWFKSNGIPLYGVNVNPRQSSWTTSPKAYGQLCIDDINLGIPLKSDFSISNRPFVDWQSVRQLLTDRGLI